jgi:hypothetical protein
MEVYGVALDIVPAAFCTHRFNRVTQKWYEVPGSEDNLEKVMEDMDTHLFVHPSSPSTGSHWMSQTISFDMIKVQSHLYDSRRRRKSVQRQAERTVSGTRECSAPSTEWAWQKSRFQVKSSHQYLPRIHLFRIPDGASLDELGSLSDIRLRADIITFVFDEARFFASTHYQNARLSELKVRS